MAGEPHQRARDDHPENGEIVMSFEPIDTPKPRTVEATKQPPPPPPPSGLKKVNEVEYDEFGLPVAKLSFDSTDDDLSDDEPPPPTAIAKPKEPAASAPPPKIDPIAPPALVPGVPIVPVAPAVDEKKDLLVGNGAATAKGRYTESMATLPEKDRRSNEVRMFSEDPKDPHMPTGTGTVSEWSHQQIVPHGGLAERRDTMEEKKEESEDEWQEMPAYASYDMYDDDGRLIARAHEDSEAEEDTGAAKGYTRVYDDEDAESVTSMDENTNYLFKENDDDEAARNPLSQMKATKELLTEGQRIAYVGVCRLALIEMLRDLQQLKPRGKNAKKNVQKSVDGMIKWSQKIMVRLYTHMELSPPEQIMIEQLAEHGVLPSDLTPALMQNSRVHNPMASSPNPTGFGHDSRRQSFYSRPSRGSLSSLSSPALPEYQDTDLESTKTLSQLPQTRTLDIDLRWTILCDLFLVLIADSVYDARARVMLERVGVMFDVSWLDICKFEKRVTDALEMQESTEQNWAEQEHLDARRKEARNKRFMMLGLATVGGGLVIGLSGGLLAPVIGAGLAAGFATIGVAGTSGFLVGTGGTALIASGAAISGGLIGGRAGFNRMKSVSTFEFKPLHNAKRVNLIITVSGWMNGKVDDVRLPFSTVDPIMGDLFSIYWEPEMLQSMGQTISILATEALTQTLQQVLGSTILISLMAAIQLPVVLTKLAYLLDNPWSVSLDRAAAAGLILADTLIHRNLGVRPVTLVGYSLGARVIYFCLRELARVGASGLVQNAYMFGLPIVVKKDEYAQAASVVSGRIVNGYATNDWILGYLFRATSGGIGSIGGLAPIDMDRVENIDVTELVNGHMAYRAAMPKLLRKVGWEVTSDEFSEIEDPDPDNHQQRQRELINELDEARKELEQGNRKRKWNLFGRNKDPVKKRDWEMYDTTGNTTSTSAAAAMAAGATMGTEGGTNAATGNNNGVLFDIDAIRAEIEKSSKEEQLPKDFEKLHVDAKPYSTSLAPADPGLRHTKSFDDRIQDTKKGAYEERGYGSFDLDDSYRGDIQGKGCSTPPPSYAAAGTSAGAVAMGYGALGGMNVWADDEYDDEFAPKGDGEMEMTFA